MRTNDAKSKACLGFLTVIEHPDHSLFGGYLVLNLAGRPLEFHCTAPVRPNRAQQILYGPTLEPYLFGEQIGQTLITKAKAEPVAVCTDRLPALSVRECLDLPVVLVLPNEESASAGRSGDEGGVGAREERVRTVPAELIIFDLGRNRVAVSRENAEDQKIISERLASCLDWLDLAEPFQRIRDAIDEARRGGQAA